MQLTQFNAYCPFEIGDKIKKRRRVSTAEAECFNLDPTAVVEEVHTITDIVCEHSVKHGTVTFLYELDDSGTLVHIVAPSAKEQAARPAAKIGPTKPIPTSTANGLPPEFKEFIKKRFG